MAGIKFEFEQPCEKKGAPVSVRLSEEEEKDLTQCSMACGFKNTSDYIRATLYFAKPILLRMKDDPSFTLIMIGQMTRRNF